MLQALATGQRIGAYAIEGRVGEGGMGTVYRARDTSLGRVVALKVIRDTGATETDGPAADVIARFLREARLGASLSHPNIAVVYEAGAFGDLPYLAMEWVEGQSLAALGRDPACSLAQRVEILDAVADALAYAHARGVIHRDVKPSNVMVDARGRARLVDFGIAKRTANFAPGTMMLPTHARQVLGTPAYMAPEQMLSSAVDGRADQFSWGVMAYELLGGAHPNATVPPDGSPFPVAKPKPLGWVRADVPDAIGAVVHRAVSYEPGARFASMDDLVSAWRAAKSAVAGSSASGPYGAPPGASLSSAITQGTGPGYATAPGYGTGSTSPSSPQGVAPTMNLTGASGSWAPPPGPPVRAAHLQRSQRSFPWAIVLATAGAALLILGAGVAVIAINTGNGTSVSLPVASPLPFGPKSASLENFDDLKFAPPAPDVPKTKAAFEAKIATCFAASSVAKEQMFTAEVEVTADGRIAKVGEQNVCKEQHPSFYLCTERGKTPKKGFPSVPDDVFACLERTLLATRLPKVVVETGKTTASAKFDMHVQ